MKIDQLKSGVVLSYLSMGLGSITSIIYTPIMLSLLGQNEYGLYTLVSSVVVYLSTLSLAFNSSYVRYYSRLKAQNNDEGISNLNGMFMLVFIILGIVALIAGGILTFFVGDIFKEKLTPDEVGTAKILMALLVVNVAVSFPFSVFTSYITANERYFFLKLLNLIKVIINPFVILPILLMGYKSIGMVVGTVALNICIEIVNLIYALKVTKMKFGFKHFDFALLKDIAIFSSFILINIVVDQVNWNIDKFLLGIYHGSVSVAIYGVAAQLNSYFQQVPSTISSVFVPRVHRLVAQSTDNKEISILFSKVGRIQYIVVAFVILNYIFYGREFIKFWAGEQYNDSYITALFLILSMVIPLIQNLGIEIRRAKNLHKQPAIFMIFISLINLCISIPLCKHFGPVGCAIGTFISIIVNTIYCNFYYHLKVKIDIKYFWKQILKLLPATLVSTVFAFAISKIFNGQSLKDLIISVGLFGISYCLIILIIGLNKYEKNIILDVIKKRRKEID